MTFDDLILNVTDWADAKDLLHKKNAHMQSLKVMEELGETMGAILKNKNEAEIADGIGDTFVTLIILSKQLGLSPTECLDRAWNEIKDRNGSTVNGIFIKNS